MTVLMDDVDRLISYAPFVETQKPIEYREAVIGEAVVGAVDQQEHVISSKRSMFFSCQDRNIYVHAINSNFILASLFNHRVPLGSVKLFKERLSMELSELLDGALNREESKVVKFEDLIR